MKYVIGVDLGTSSVKVILVDETGIIINEATKDYPLYQPNPGFSEQNPDDWVEQTLSALKELSADAKIDKNDIVAMSFSGQMHGLVLIDKDGKPIRNAILWNDTRTTKQCEEITNALGKNLIDISKNKALEGFTLPKILWVKENEPDLFDKADKFLLPKDYLRYKLTGLISMEYSDAAGTLMLDVTQKIWSETILNEFNINKSICPDLIESTDFSGCLLKDIADEVGLSSDLKIYAGGADNACGAVGAGIVKDGDGLCSIGTSGVLLAYEKDRDKNFNGDLHFFNHAQKDSYYIMGVTLAAGYSLSWFKDTFAKDISFEELLSDIDKIKIGSEGLIFTPYIMGERTPYADSKIRGSFIGMSGNHNIKHFTRAVLEGIVFSLRDSLEIINKSGKKLNKIVSIGGGAKNEAWLQMQADIFNCDIVKLKSEQGPALGASMIAAVGYGLFDNFNDCAEKFIEIDKIYSPIEINSKEYDKIYKIYAKIYGQTKTLNTELYDFR